MWYLDSGDDIYIVALHHIALHGIWSYVANLWLRPYRYSIVITMQLHTLLGMKAGVHMHAYAYIIIYWVPIQLHTLIGVKAGVHVHWYIIRNVLDVGCDEVTLCRHTLGCYLWDFEYIVCELLAIRIFVMYGYLKYWRDRVAMTNMISDASLWWCVLWYGLWTVEILYVLLQCIPMGFNAIANVIPFFSGICSVLGICSVFMLPIFLVVMEAYMLWLLRVVNYCSTWTLYQLLW